MNAAVRDVEPSELSMWPPPDGYTTEWVPDPTCRPATAEELETRRCRRPRCGGIPVMALNRSHRPGGGGARWWLYCAEHLYGRRIRAGVVEHRVAIRVES